MRMRQDYVLSTLQLVLGLVTGIGIFYWTPSNYITWLLLIPALILFGLTAASSTQNFHHSVWFSGSILMFALFGVIEAFITIFVLLTNITLSYFAGPRSGFRDFYSATSLPVFLTAVLVSSILAGFIYIDDDTEEQLKTEFISLSAQQVEFVAESAGQQDSHEAFEEQMVSISQISVNKTQSQVTSDISTELTPDQTIELQEAFTDAYEEVPQETVEDLELAEQSQEMDPQELTRDYVNTHYESEYLVLLIPLTIIFVFALQPIIGLGTAIFAKLSIILDKVIRKRLV